MEAFNDYTYRFLETIEKLGLTDYKVWNTLENLSKATMSKIRRGICGVSMNTLQEFCQTYQVNANYILTGKGNMFLNSESPALLSKEEVEGMPSPESAEYWERMYKSAVTTYEAMLQNLEERFNALDKPLKDMRELLVERKKIV